MIELNFKEWLLEYSRPHKTVVIGQEPHYPFATQAKNAAANVFAQNLEKQMYHRGGLHPPVHIRNMDYEKTSQSYVWTITKELPDNYNTSDVRTAKEAADQEILAWIKQNEPETYRTLDLMKRKITTKSGAGNEIVISLNIPPQHAFHH